MNKHETVSSQLRRLMVFEDQVLQQMTEAYRAGMAARAWLHENELLFNRVSALMFRIFLGLRKDISVLALIILLLLKYSHSATSVFLREREWFIYHTVGRPPKIVEQAIVGLSIGRICSSPALA
ncbi:MAG TPA: hypothetical protein VEU96_04195 [Bryobacteraceae bacterium]|nr:hypothetical protein [Bryobacteraceae bacterium]